MAPTLLVIALLVFAIFVQGTLGNNIECENLNEDSCAYAVSSSGKRCVLENRLHWRGFETYMCGTSEIAADKLNNWIETEECISACGVDRKALGISSDSLLDRNFVGKLCSKGCYHKCANIVDLYFNLAAGEGVYLPKFCNGQQSNGRREMAEIKSAGVAPGPEAAATYHARAAASFQNAPAAAPAN